VTGARRMVATTLKLLLRSASDWMSALPTKVPQCIVGQVGPTQQLEEGPAQNEGELLRIRGRSRSVRWV